MLIQRFMGAAALPLVLACSVSAGGQSTLICRGPDETSQALITELQEWMSTTDPERIADRDTLYHVPVVRANQIALVTDERICTKVAQAYGAPPGVTARLYTVKLGSKGYVAYDPEQKAGDYKNVLIFSTRYVRIGGWTGG